MHKSHFSRLGRDIHLKQTVDRGGVPPGQLRQALGRTPGRGGQQRFDMELIKQGQNPCKRGGFAGTGAAREDQDTLARSAQNGLPLQLCIRNALCKLDLADERVRLFELLRLDCGHAEQPLGEVLLGLVVLRQIGCLEPRDGIEHHPPLLLQTLCTGLDEIVRQAQ